MKLRLIIGSGTTYGRTTQNSTLLDVLVFHLTLSTSKASYIRRFCRAHPKGELKQSMFFLQDPIMRTNLQYLVHFIQQEFLEIHYYNTKFRVWNLNIRITINIYGKIQGSVCAHQKNPPHNSHSSSYTCNRGK